MKRLKKAWIICKGNWLVLISLQCCLNSFVSYSQTYADRKFYLVDSLDLSALTESERILIDSSLQVYHQTNVDTVKLNSIYAVCDGMIHQNWERYQTLHYNLTKEMLSSKTLRNQAEILSLKKHLALAYNNLGIIYNSSKINPKKAIDFFNKSILIQKEIGDKREVGISINNLANIKYNQGLIKEALNHFSESLKISEELRDKRGIAHTLSNMGSLLQDQGELNQALAYYERSIVLREELGDKMELASSLNNLGTLYDEMKQSNKSLELYERSLSLRREIGDKEGVAIALNNIGFVYQNERKFEQALDFHFKSLEIRIEINDKLGMVDSYNNISAIKMELGDMDEARELALKAFQLSKEIGFPVEVKACANLLSRVAQKQGNWKEAFEMQSLEIKMNDTLRSEENIKATAQLQIKYEYEKEQALRSKEHENQLAVAAEQEKRQKFISFCITGGLLLVSAFLFFVFNRLKLTRKQKQIIEETHHKLEVKNLEVMDSIRYAQRIQQALLKNESLNGSEVPDYFILFRPKDIVSGDFYWTLLKQEHWYIAAADCTGHGVPGAFLTMLGTSFLNEINSSVELLSPSQIIDQLREKIIRELSQTGEFGQSKDGLDISLARLNLKTRELQWSGANNPLWIIRNARSLSLSKCRDNEIQSGASSSSATDSYISIEEVKADKQPVGFSYNMTSFSNYQTTLNSGDYFCLFTDGYADQFGGLKGKKYKYAALKNKLLEIYKLPSEKQRDLLDKEFENWKGSHEQIDDVCIIGVRI